MSAVFFVVSGHADLEGHARVRRHPLSRLAGPGQHGAHGPGSLPAGRSRDSRRRCDRRRRRPDRRGSPRAGAGRSRQGAAQPASWRNPPGRQRRASARRQRSFGRVRGPRVSRASRRLEPHLSLPHFPQAHRVRQALRLVGPGPAGLRRDGDCGAALPRPARLLLLL